MMDASYKKSNKKGLVPFQIMEFTPSQQNHKSWEHLFLTVGAFMQVAIDNMHKTIDKKLLYQKQGQITQ